MIEKPWQGAADDHVELARLKVQLSAERGGVDLFDRAVVGVSRGVVRSEGFYCPVVDVVCVQTDEAGTAESFGYTTSAAE